MFMFFIVVDCIKRDDFLGFLYEDNFICCEYKNNNVDVF